jgi:hypothetical protein
VPGYYRLLEEKSFLLIDRHAGKIKQLFQPSLDGAVALLLRSVRQRDAHFPLIHVHRLADFVTADTEPQRRVSRPHP